MLLHETGKEKVKKMGSRVHKRKSEEEWVCEFIFRSNKD